MCGIAGRIVLALSGSEKIITRMTGVVEHRGPDGDGFYTSADKKVSLGHRRLKIIDLSERARQPMSNRDGTVWLIFNGEIYNYRELDEILKAKGYRYHSQADSETIVHAYEEWGESCVERFNGMFAFAIWDEREKKLFCARDRFGEKPFYYFKDEKQFLFASEIKSLLEDSSVERAPNYKTLATLASYLQHNTTDINEETFFKGIDSLPAAHTLTLKDGRLAIRRYWSLPDERPDIRKSESQWTEEFLELLKDSVRLRLRSDVPVGT
jgi:asparagine synthase (glutamine-hydrolysing)